MSIEQKSFFEGTDALATLIREMRMIAIVAGQWSVENEDDEAHSMAAEEARRASRWADTLEAVVASLPSPVVPHVQQKHEMSRASEPHTASGRTGSPRSPQPDGSAHKS